MVGELVPAEPSSRSLIPVQQALAPLTPGMDERQLRDAIIGLMRIPTADGGLDRSPFALALYAIEDVIEMVSAGQEGETREALTALRKHFRDLCKALLKLMRDHPLGMDEPPAVSIPPEMAHLTTPAMEALYARWESEPLSPGEQVALQGIKLLWQHAHDVIHYACMEDMGNDADRITLLHGALSDFCMRWDQATAPVIDGFCTYFPDLKEAILAALGIRKKLGNAERPSFDRIVAGHREQRALPGNKSSSERI